MNQYFVTLLPKEHGEVLTLNEGSRVWELNRVIPRGGGKMWQVIEDNKIQEMSYYLLKSHPIDYKRGDKVCSIIEGTYEKRKEILTIKLPRHIILAKGHYLPVIVGELSQQEYSYWLFLKDSFTEDNIELVQREGLIPLIIIRKDMKQFSEFSTQQLEQELERRRQEESLITPKQKEIVDDIKLRRTLSSIIQEIENGNYHEDNDNKHYIYEEVMKAYYGDDFFTWFNKKIQ